MRPNCVILFRTHVWPVGNTGDTAVKGVNQEAVLARLLEGISKYNECLDSKYNYKLCILHNDAEKSDFYIGDTFGFDYHVFTLADVKAHGFTTNKCSAFKRKFAGISFDKTSSAFLRGHPMWFNTEFGVLDYFLRCDSSLAHYWSIEYDCWPEGDFSEYLKSFDNAEEDFLVSRLTCKQEGNKWFPWWDIIAGFSPKLNYGSFFPIFRISGAAVSALVSGYRSGVCGYCETLVPTYLRHIGLSCAGLMRYDKQYKGKCWIKHKHNSNIVTIS